MPSRRQVLAGVGSAGTAALAGCVGGDGADYSPGEDADADWPMPRFDPTNTAYSPDAKAPRESVRERWTYEGGFATGPPAVADGTVFLPTAEALVALDAASGEEQWRFAPDGQPWTAPPVVHDGTAYVTGVTDSGVYAIDASSGDAVWSVADAGGARGGVHLLAGEYVSEPVVYAGGENGGLVRLDAATGEETWRTDLFGSVSAFGYRLPQLYVGTRGGEVYALVDSVDGADEPDEAWRRKVGSAVRTVLPSGEGVLVHTFGDPLYCLQDGAHAGTTRWTVDQRRANSAPVAANYTFFAAGYGSLTAFRDYDSDTTWRLGGRFDATGPVAAGDTLYASSRDAVHAFALDGGSWGAFGHRFDAKRWSHPTPAGATEGLAVGDGAVFASCQGSEDSDVSLYCLEPAN
ncbi:outer membrane protein assembly factor BamB family protein [Halorussus halobius]|uniref:outer membrane protein assembly factor BamB family protein n=1 Tax=Halorussus halobius TaxID=1710537 RepID=UPI0010927D26|nr:PQQ-binding-like beta-propeller repeat protein [Halorussus halobius]